MQTPRATYRLQFTRDFGFADAARIAPYLAALGISHVYASPYLQACPGSTHGYDVIDPGRVDDALGGADGHARMCVALAARGLGQLVDIVPNHMAVGTPENRWWWDVLENGPSSRYAAYFDVDWSQNGDDRILLPILGERYGDALADSLISVERRGGTFVVCYRDHLLPCAPRSLEPVLEPVAERVGSDLLAFLSDALAGLPAPSAVDRRSTERRHRDKAVITRQLGVLFGGDRVLAAAVDAALAELSGRADALDRFLERQNWRLAFWRTATSELSYRRFFDVHTLVGLRVEDPAVFADTHALVLRWLADGVVAGLRIDHVDGLRDPTEYLARLRAAAPDAWIVVEKILAPGEALPAPWPVDGTTGYDFMRLVDGAFVDRRAAPALRELWQRFTGETMAWDEAARAARVDVIEASLTAERDHLVELALRVAASRPALRDLTRREMTAAMTELLAAFPVYRTYLRVGDPISDADRAVIAAALDAAAVRAPDVDARVWTMLGQVMRLEVPEPLAEELALRLQQTSGAVMAKGIEDTLFYRDASFAALNEVGGAPERFGVELDELHRGLAALPAGGLLATATHDTKRGEDVRARLAALSEIPDEWAAAVERWSARATRHRTGDAPDRATEYLIWQTVVGAWPISIERAQAYLLKAAREAKRGTSWLRPSRDHELSIERLVAGILGDVELVADIEKLVARLAPAGQRNALARTLIKLTAPGVPDLYQGAELWDLRPVDPDNRTPVDFDRLRRLLGEVAGASPEAILARAADGLPKLWLIQRLLAARQEEPDRFAGAYRRLVVRGGAAERVIAYARGDRLVVVVPRLGPPDGSWGDTAVALPAGRWRDLATGDAVDGDAAAPVAALWARFPVAALGRLS